MQVLQAREPALARATREWLTAMCSRLGRHVPWTAPGVGVSERSTKEGEWLATNGGIGG